MDVIRVRVRAGDCVPSWVNWCSLIPARCGSDELETRVRRRGEERNHGGGGGGERLVGLALGTRRCFSAFSSLNPAVYVCARVPHARMHIRENKHPTIGSFVV